MSSNDFSNELIDNEKIEENYENSYTFGVKNSESIEMAINDYPNKTFLTRFADYIYEQQKTPNSHLKNQNKLANFDFSFLKNEENLKEITNTQFSFPNQNFSGLNSEKKKKIGNF